jgi:hypothetical protein
MSARDELEKLKKEFISLNTEDERKEFDVKFKNVIDKKNEKEKREFADAFSAAAKEDVARIQEFCNEVSIRIKLEKVLHVISMSYIAHEYFKKSKYWFSQKLNGNLKNGKVSSFTDEELKTLAFALDDIGKTLQNTARSIA